MPYIEVMEKDLARLRELAGIFEVKDVITRLIDDFLEDYTKPEVISEAALAGAEEFSFDDLPSLVHVKFVSARIGEIASNANTWNGFLNQVLEVAFSRLGSITPIQRSVGLNIISGEKTDEGYRYVETANISVQGVSASYAAKYVGQLAKLLKTPVSIDFMWRNKEEAFRPGESGRLVYTP